MAGDLEGHAMFNPGKNRISDRIGSKLQKIVRKKKGLRNALLLVHSDKQAIHWKFAAGTTGPEGIPISPDSPYHIASIGKTFTSVLLAIMYERGKVRYDDPVSKHLPPKMLEGLFVYGGTDYAGQVSIGQLLNHTSGIGDYYEDKPIRGKSIKELVVEEPDRLWKPEETIAFTRENQQAVAAPGKRFHYSDTGYHLLGKIVESISSRPLHENLHTEIFEPLGMVHSCVPFYSEPREKSPHRMADVFLGENEISGYKSITVDWAGGGIVSTTEDLLLFQQALIRNALIKKETFELCTRDLGRFSYGMDYGYGILFLNVGKMTAVLPKALKMWGNFGSIGAYMFYNPAYDIYLIGTFNHSNYAVKQVFFVIDLIRRVSKPYR